MKVLSIGMDRKLFEENSDVLARSKSYANNMEELHIIVFSLRNLNLTAVNIGNLHIYPTNSLSKINYIFDAIKIGKKIIKKNVGSMVLTAQDPFETGLVGYRLKKIFCLPLQLQIHTDFLSSYFKNSLLNKFRVILANFLIPRSDALRVVSSVIADSVKIKFPNLKAKIEILPIFVDTEKFIEGKPKTNLKEEFPQFDKIILIASDLQKKKVNVALNTFKIILSQFPKTGLIIAGTGPEKSYLENMAKNIGISKSVAFVGWQGDLISLYKTSDIFLLTSEYEGYGLTLIEAGTSGCPIVTTKVGIAKTDLFKSGINSYVCSIGDVDCLSKSIIDLITNEQKSKLFKDKMQDSIKVTSITGDKYVSQYVGLLQNLKND